MRSHPYIKSIIKSIQQKSIQKCLKPIKTKQDKKILAFPEKVKPLCNNKPALEKVVLFYGILRNVAGMIDK